MSDWQRGTIGELANGYRGVTYSAGQLREFKAHDTVTLLRSNNISGGQLNVKDVQIVSERIVSDDQFLTPGDIAVCMSNGSKALVGKSAQLVTASDERFTVGAFCSVFRPQASVNSRFVAYVFQSISFRSNLDLALAGTAINNLRNAQVEAFACEIPPYEEQSKIAQILDTLDTAIRETEALIDKLKAVKQGLRHDLLTRGIDASGQLRPPQIEAPQLYKDSPLGWIPREWALTHLGKVAALQRGYDIVEAKLAPGPFPVISSSGVVGYHNTSTSSGPNVVVGRKGSIGTVHYAETDIWAHDTSLFVTNFFGNRAKFVFYLLRYLNLEQYGTKSGSPSLNRNDIHPLLVGRPSLDEQTEIVRILDSHKDEISRLEQELDKLIKLKAGLMDDLLTGRVRVTSLLESRQQTAAPTEA